MLILIKLSVTEVVHLMNLPKARCFNINFEPFYVFIMRRLKPLAFVNKNQTVFIISRHCEDVRKAKSDVC